MKTVDNLISRNQLVAVAAGAGLSLGALWLQSSPEQSGAIHTARKCFSLMLRGASEISYNKDVNTIFVENTGKQARCALDKDELTGNIGGNYEDEGETLIVSNGIKLVKYQQRSPSGNEGSGFVFRDVRGKKICLDPSRGHLVPAKCAWTQMSINSVLGIIFEGGKAISTKNVQ